MGLFSKKVKVDPAELVDLHGEIESLRQRLEASDAERDKLAARVLTLNDITSLLNARSNEIDEMTQRMAEVDVIKRQIAQLDVVNAKLISLESLNGKLADLADRVNVTSNDAKAAKDQTVTLNERVSNLSREFANQLGELSHELDELSSRPAPAPVMAGSQTVSDDMIEQLHDGQVRLATEQARYEIAFRQDLATLADQLRRPSN
ncbi:MAG: hypothetical protein JWM34_1924 [Ilumatobacteraceae bacterium]|nr:hypothetical protein [Ilumatobacteraceae bacterium]